MSPASTAVHRDVGEQIDHFGQQVRGRNREARVAHVAGIARALGAQPAQPREHVVGDDVEHRLRVEVREHVPAQVAVGAPPGKVAVIAVGEDRVLDHAPKPRDPVLLHELQVVKALDEQQVGDLLDDLDRVGDSARPEGIPHAIDLALELVGHPASSLARRQK
jgi:hypothetical protein